MANFFSILHKKLVTGVSDPAAIDIYKEAMQDFHYTTRCIKTATELLDLDIGKRILDGNISDEEIVKEAKNSGIAPRLELNYDRPDHNNYRTKDVIRIAKGLLSDPKYAITLITQSLHSEKTNELCHKYKEDLSKPRCQYIFHLGKSAFIGGMKGLSRLYNHEYPNCLPQEFSTNLVRFMASDPNFRTLLEANICHSAAYSLYVLIARAHVDEKPKVVNIIAGDPLLKSTLIDDITYPGDLAIAIARGLTPPKFKDMLDRTGLFSFFEGTNLGSSTVPGYNASLKDRIAKDALDYFGEENINPQEHAEEIMAIALNHCKPAQDSDHRNNPRHS